MFIVHSLGSRGEPGRQGACIPGQEDSRAKEETRKQWQAVAKITFGDVQSWESRKASRREAIAEKGAGQSEVGARVPGRAGGVVGAWCGFGRLGA